MKYNPVLYGILALLGCLAGGCDNNGIDELRFDADLNDVRQTYRVNEPVTFAIHGSPDYLVFYSGENGKKYANRHRTTAEVEELSLVYNLELNYARKNYRNGVKVWVSDDFDGVLDEASIGKATWTDMEGKLKVPVIDNPSEGYVHGNVKNVTVDLSDYKYKPFYIALELDLEPLTPQELAAGQAHPDVHFYPKLIQTVDGNQLEKTSPKADFGFNFVKIKYNDDPKDNPTVTVADDAKVTINGRRGRNGTHIWAVSQAIDASTVDPDEGTSIKSYSSELAVYEYVYTRPGEYTATFSARNANAWNCTEQIKEVKVVVTE